MQGDLPALLTTAANCLFFFFFLKTLLILTETSTGTDRVHQAAANTEERPHIFTDNNACGAPIKPVLVPYY